MAMEKLVAVQADPRYDLIILDTPPTANALDFLDAPERIVAGARLGDDALVHPRRSSRRASSRSTCSPARRRRASAASAEDHGRRASSRRWRSSSRS
jgi:anion-transporting  ArsA/GET3 family ATPase